MSVSLTPTQHQQEYQEAPKAPPEALSWTRLLWWTAFATAFGYVEAAVVMYLRRMSGMLPGLDYPAIWALRGLPFDSAHILELLRREGVLAAELGREVATLLLLFGAAWGAGRTLREKWGIFALTFAVWDLTYYVWLALLTGFPRSLAATDIYYLIPVAWYGPVWFPVCCFMPATIFLALRLLRTPSKGKRVPLNKTVPESTNVPAYPPGDEEQQR
ncbi:MAG TPA: hypothetical protein VKU00_15300 [Chthonomonadaceae bacterium]|nr:hypothetical protein [Chthonomonadaceae bacterium]